MGLIGGEREGGGEERSLSAPLAVCMEVQQRNKLW